MSRRRSSRSNRSRGNRNIRANNILVAKLVDPVVQSLLFVFFIYCLDSDVDTMQYQTVITIIVFWQVISCVVNFILNHPEQMKVQRIMALIAMIVYYMAARYIMAHVQERQVVISLLNNVTINLYEAIIETGALVIAFWYYIICFREIRAMLTSVTNESA